MENSIIKLNNKLEITNNTNNVVFIKYQHYNKDSEILASTADPTYSYYFSKDGVYEVYQIEVSGDYTLESNVLKKGNEVVHDFNNNEYDAIKINEFIDGVIPKKYISLNKMEDKFSKLVLCLLDYKIKGACKLPKDLITERDLLIMAIMSINIFEKNNLYYEAQRIIESFNDLECSNDNCGCNG